MSKSKFQILSEKVLGTKDKLATAKTDDEKLAAEVELEELNKEIEAAKAAEQSKPTKVEKAKKELSIMNKQKVDALYVNPSGAYFTSLNLAELSVKDKKQVKELTREVVESQIK
jgi:hypothetical protein